MAVGTVLAGRPGFGELARAVDMIAHSGWWTRLLHAGPAPGVEMRRAGGGGSYLGWTNTIRLGPDASWAVAIHEVAHCLHHRLDPRAPHQTVHGAEFRGWLIVTYEAVFGIHASTLLRSSMVSFGLDVRVPDVEMPIRPIRPIDGPGPVRGGWQRR